MQKTDITQLFLLPLISLLILVSTSCSWTIPCQENILITDIEPTDLPKLDYKTSVGYATFEGVFCRVMYENGAFVFKDFQNRQIWPCMTGKIENVCWNAVRDISGHQREFEKDESFSFGFLKINLHESRAIRNVDVPLHLLTPFEKAVIGSFSFNSETRDAHSIIQYPDKISFSDHGDVWFTTKYRFDAVSSPLHFNGNNILVSLIGHSLDFTDMETKRTIETFHKKEYLESAGVLRHEKKDYLVVITSNPYEENAQLYVYAQKINLCKQGFNEIFSQKISGRSHKLVEGPDNSLIAYHLVGHSNIIAGLKISIKKAEGEK